MAHNAWHFGDDDYSLLLNGMTSANLTIGWEDGDVKIIELTKQQFDLILTVLGLETRGSEWSADGQRHRQFVCYPDEVLALIDENIYEAKAVSTAVKERYQRLNGKWVDPNDLI